MQVNFLPIKEVTVGTKFISTFGPSVLLEVMAIHDGGKIITLTIAPNVHADIRRPQRKIFSYYESLIIPA
jgi:hypothetical protein